MRRDPQRAQLVIVEDALAPADLADQLRDLDQGTGVEFEPVDAPIDSPLEERVEIVEALPGRCVPCNSMNCFESVPAINYVNTNTCLRKTPCLSNEIGHFLRVLMWTAYPQKTLGASFYKFG